mmetsp:Transcript_83442/g.131411  ORF Transcript_83442/g.131411 Transcript_83442/m.131411 type:complete len:208 (-) Transcript_83442:384-1007(-)
MRSSSSCCKSSAFSSTLESSIVVSTFLSAITGWFVSEALLCEGIADAIPVAEGGAIIASGGFIACINAAAFEDMDAPPLTFFLINSTAAEPTSSRGFIGGSAPSSTLAIGANARSANNESDSWRAAPLNRLLSSNMPSPFSKYRLHGLELSSKPSSRNNSSTSSRVTPSSCCKSVVTNHSAKAITISGERPPPSSALLTSASLSLGG